MPVKINDEYLVPAPLVTFGKNYLRSADGTTVGAEYTVSLDGTIFANRGNPVVDSGTFLSTFSGTYDDPNHGIDPEGSLLSLMSKQERIRKVFSKGEAVLVEILGLDSSNGIRFVGNVQSINFPNQGRWVNPCPYTVSLTTTNFETPVNSSLFGDDSTEDGFEYYIRDANESWSVEEAEEKFFRVNNTDILQSSVKAYRVSHNVSAVGQPAYTAKGPTISYVSGQAPWQQASGYVYSVIGSNFPSGAFFPTSASTGPFVFGHSDFGTNGGGDSYILTDQKISENIDQRAGSYSVTESFVAYPSGAFTYGIPALHSVNVDTSQGEDGITTVTINGTINGLNTINPIADAGRHTENKLLNARLFFQNLKNNVDGGISADSSAIYHIARISSESSWLHPRHKSHSAGENPNGGTITYSYTYDNRPPNIINGSIIEDIQISDTYPGQNFSSTPVIGRNQPVLQYLNSRSEYKRSLSINITMAPFSSNWTSDITDIIPANGYWSDAEWTHIANWTYTNKPSITNTVNFAKIFAAANPANEAGVVAGRVFHSAPQESWNPKTGAYSYSIEWTYERTT
tara:strand:- start:609 stop:2321 length:1713 start_codon:yes stop_codon:yes gene_type:complete